MDTEVVGTEEKRPSERGPGQGQAKEGKQSKRTGRLLRLVRRIHLYLGLFLTPWVLLFGITALSFNHPTVGRGIEGRMIPSAELKEHTGVAPFDPSRLAREVTGRLSGGNYQLTEDSARFHGWPLFARAAPGGKEVVILGLDQGRAIVTKRNEVQESRSPDFRGEEIRLDEFSMPVLAKKLEGLHEALSVPTSGPLRPHPEIHPELRFVVRDEKGTSWNVVYDLTTGIVDGRPSQEDRHAPLIELLESLHKQHHYPASLGPTFFWALFADLTALTLLIWATTGLVMWWQLKKLRLVGAVVVVSALTIAGLVMTSTAGDLSFGPERAGP